MASLKSATSPIGPKLRNSCDSCADAKVGCTKEKPACSRCVKRGLSCVYGATKRSGRSNLGRPHPRANSHASVSSIGRLHLSSPSLMGSPSGSMVDDSGMMAGGHWSAHPITGGGMMPSPEMNQPSARKFSPMGDPMFTGYCPTSAGPHSAPGYLPSWNPNELDELLASAMPLDMSPTQTSTYSSAPYSAQPVFEFGSDNLSDHDTGYWNQYPASQPAQYVQQHPHHHQEPVPQQAFPITKGYAPADVTPHAHHHHHHNPSMYSAPAGVTTPPASIKPSPANSISSRMSEPPTKRPRFTTTSEDGYLAPRWTDEEPTFQPHQHHQPCKCQTQALSALVRLAPNSTTSTSGAGIAACTIGTDPDPDSRFPDASAVLLRNEQVVDTVSDILQCACASNGYVPVLLAQVVSSLLAWYAAVASAPASSPTDETDNTTMTPHSPSPVVVVSGTSTTAAWPAPSTTEQLPRHLATLQPHLETLCHRLAATAPAPVRPASTSGLPSPRDEGWEAETGKPGAAADESSASLGMAMSDKTASLLARPFSGPVSTALESDLRRRLAALQTAVAGV